MTGAASDPTPIKTTILRGNFGLWTGEAYVFTGNSVLRVRQEQIAQHGRNKGDQ